MVTYLDNSATTRVCREAADKAMAMMTEEYGNPSSLHTMGFRAEQELTAAREAVGRLIGAPAEQLTFTSGGTEANNLAILGWAQAHTHGGHHIVTTAVEHSSVTAAVEQLEKTGYEVTRIIPNADGTITAQQIVDACRADTGLVAVMLVNNETGARFPLEQAVPAIRRVSPQVHIHCDAVQAAGKIPVQAVRWDVDTLSLSAHKIHGPKGCGALYIKKGVRLAPRQLGGKQESGRRGGTEATPLIAAFGAAADCVPPVAGQLQRYDTLRRRLIARLQEMDGVVLHLPQGGVPYIVHLSVPGLRSETMLHFLAAREVYVSSGSACAKGARSPVLTAMGLPPAEIDSALRVSFSRETAIEDIDRFVEVLDEATRSLVHR